MSKQKRIRVTFDVILTVDEDAIPQGESPDEQAYNARQKRLLQAILSNDHDAFIRCEVTQLFESTSWQDWHKLLLARDPANDVHHESLKPFIEKLDQADQEWFRETEEMGLLYENTELVTDHFSVALKGAEIAIEGEVQP